MGSRKVLVAVFVVLAVGGGVLVVSCGDDAPERPDTILLFTIDTLRWDHVSANAPIGTELPEPQTPALDTLAAAGVRFSDARAAVPLTLPSHVTMLAGLPPAVTGVRLNTYGRLPPREIRGFDLLPETLHDAGWTTGAFVSAAVLGRRFGLDEAFDHFDDGGLEDGGSTAVSQRPGADTVAAALAWLRKREAGEKVFLWVHIFEPHAPYAETGTYAGGVVAADAVARTLLDGLDATRPGAAVLATSDHGEALGELRERTHGFLLSDGTLRVPFLLRGPGLSSTVRADPVTLPDVAPTLAALAGATWPARHGPGVGRNLLAGPAPADRIRVAESLYGHQLHRWAQLRSATGAAGTLVNAGRGRDHWLPISGWQRVLPSTGLVKDTDEVRRLNQALVEYNRSEDPDRMVQGESVSGYSGGGPVSPFLPAEANARLPDPHHDIVLHQELDALKARIFGEHLPSGQPVPQAARIEILQRTTEELRRMLEQPGLHNSPEARFLAGEAWYRLGLARGGDDAAFRGAEEAFLQAFELGRKDTQTLVRACGARAVGREEEALTRLEDLARQVPALGCQYWLLRARLIQELEKQGKRPAGSTEEACKAAENACRSSKDRAAWERTCR